jgi:single-stranded-DNA-specific exonuclease
MEYGGHEKAAGITLRSENIQEVRKKLNKYTRDIYPDLSFVPVLDIDMDLSPDEIDIGELEHIERLRPFGNDNPSPIISIRDAMVGNGSRTVGDGRHLKFCVEDGSFSIDCIYFNGGDMHDQLRPGMMVSIAGEPSIHRWRGRETMQLRIVDIRTSE